jgi:hypothetical protein
MGQQGFDVSRLTMGQKGLFITGALFFIALFLPWESVGAFGIAVGNVSGFQGIGVLAGITVIALLVWEGINAAGVNLNLNVSAAVVSAILGAATVLFGLIRFLIAVTRGATDPAFGAWIGIILLVAMGYATWVRFQESQTGTAPPAPPAPPAA